jgi:hypothetical protein
MDAKKLTSLTILNIMLTANLCFAGDTTISGATRCFMPEMVEIQSRALAAAQTPQIKSPAAQGQSDAAFIVSGASGAAIVQKEEKLIQTEDVKTADKGNEVVVYSVCAK